MQQTRLLALRFVEGFRQAQRERGAANQRCLISWDADLKPRALRGDSRSADSPQSKVGLCALPQITQIAQQKAADSPDRLNPSRQRGRAAGLKKCNMPGRSSGGRVHQWRLRGHRGGKRRRGAVQGVAQRELVEQETIHRRVVRQQHIEQVVRVGWVVVTCCRVVGLGGGGACCRRTSNVLAVAVTRVGKPRRR